MNRCARCTADLEYGHDETACVELGDSITAATDRAGSLGLPTNQVAALAGSMAAYIPPGADLTAAVTAALDAWATTPREGA